MIKYAICLPIKPEYWRECGVNGLPCAANMEYTGRLTGRIPMIPGPITCRGPCLGKGISVLKHSESTRVESVRYSLLG